MSFSEAVNGKGNNWLGEGGACRMTERVLNYSSGKELIEKKNWFFKWELALSEVKIRQIMVNNYFKNVQPSWPAGKHKWKSQGDIASSQLEQVLLKRWKATINADKDAGRMVSAQPLRKTAQRLLRPEKTVTIWPSSPTTKEAPAQPLESQHYSQRPGNEIYWDVHWWISGLKGVV